MSATDSASAEPVKAPSEVTVEVDSPAATKRSPEFSAGFISRVFFLWLGPLFRAGNQSAKSGGKPLQYSDLLPLTDDDVPERISSSFERLLAKYQKLGQEAAAVAVPVIDKKTGKPAEPKPINAVTAAVREQFGPAMIRAGLLKVVNSTLQFAPPVILNYFLKNLQLLQAKSAPNNYDAFIWAIGLFLALTVRTLTENNYFHMVVRVGFQLRMAITTAVYRKALRLSPVARQEVPVGQIVNLMQLDATRLDGLCMQFHVIWDGMYQILGYMILLLIYIGPSALAGLLVMLILIPVNVFQMMRMGAYRRAIVKANDQRIKVTNEALQGIRAIKLYNWERFFISKISGIREEELTAIKAYAVQSAINSMIFQTAPVIVAIVTLLVYAGSGGDFSAATVFTAISVLNSLRFPLMMYPMVVQQVADARVSFERLNKFMNQPEVGAVAALTDAPAAAAEATVVPVDGGDKVEIAMSNPMRMAAAAGAATADASSPATTAPHKTYLAPSASAALTLPPSSVGVRLSKATFYWEEPVSRRERLKKKEAEEKAAKEKKAADDAKKAKKGANKKPAAGDAKPAGEATSPTAAGATSPKAAAATTAAAAPATPASDAPIHPVLANLDVTIPAGQLWAVVGPVGSGKSALCSAILGELARAGGEVNVNGRVAYVSQTAWVLNASVQRNVTFAGDAHHVCGSDVQAKDALYNQVLDACQLRSDLAVLPAGDKTEIGERGINLSGGQKQRVAIARAAYSGADVYLFDDPLSALDAEVGKSVFEQCIKGILDGKTRVLVTNALQYLQACDGVIVLESGSDGVGRVAHAGSFTELLASVPAFAAMMEAYGHSHGGNSKQDSNEDPSVAATPSPDAAAASPKATEAKKSAATAAATGPSASAASVATGKALMTTEEKNEGAVSSEYYWRYLKAGGNVWLNLFILFWAYVLGQFGQLLSQWWITFWSADANYVKHDQGFYMGIFVVLGIATAVLAFGRVLIMAYMGIKASRYLHSTTLATVIAAPMAFFDTTPLGRIISRFSKDMDSLDQQLPNQLGTLWMCIFFIVGTLAAIIFATPWFALVVIPVAVIYVQIMNYFRNISRETKRFDSITRSPVYAHFSETLGGLSVIRAYALQGFFAHQNEDKVAANVSAWYTLKSCDRWLSVRLEILGNMIVLAAALLAAGTAVQSYRTEGTAAGLAGFSLSYAMSITSLMNWAVRSAAETEQQMNSVERLSHYADTTPMEPYDSPVKPSPAVSLAVIKGNTKASGATPKLIRPIPVPAVETPAGWPSTGSVEYKDYRMCYREGTPEVLHGVSFAVKGGEKVGIVGRTGSGKSSLMVSLFRLIQDDCHTGDILLDSITIDGLGLSKLRSNLAIIPQEPVMFSGTIRTNLDPIGAVNDDDTLWNALEKVGLGDAIRRLNGGLNAPVAEFGESLSVGQRQLICLARVLLRRVKVILLDEATSSVDYNTDQAMQRVIRDSFSECTILTIAHRLNTIISCDRILVMEAGKVADFDTPHVLLTKQGGSIFSSLVDELGPQTSAALRQKAAEAAASSSSVAAPSKKTSASAEPAPAVTNSNSQDSEPTA